MKDKNAIKRKISKRFIIYVVVTLIIVYVILFVFATICKVDIVVFLISFIPVGIVWTIYSFITLRPYVYEKEEKLKNDEENKNV